MIGRFVGAPLAFVMFPCVALAASGTIDIGSSDNACPQNPDCPKGAHCHLSMRITGAPAKALLQALKAKVPPDAGLKALGLSIYVSKDGNLDCDNTDGHNVFCDLGLNLANASLEPIPLCE